MTEETTYSVRSRGDHVWHIPNENGTPLCGAELWRPERLFLPAKLAPDDVICEKCVKLRKAQTGKT